MGTDDRYHRVRRQPSRAYRMSCERQIRAYTAALPTYERELNDVVMPMICRLTTEIAETMERQIDQYGYVLTEDYSDTCEFLDWSDYYNILWGYFYFDDEMFSDDGASDSEIDWKALGCARRMTAAWRKLRNRRRLGFA